MNFDLRTALRYTTDTVQTLLSELQKPEHNEHRWGTDQSKSLRGFLADALREAAEGHTDAAQIQDLNKQAELLQNPEQHIVVRDGKVHPAVWSGDILRRANRVLHRLDGVWSGVTDAHFGLGWEWGDQANGQVKVAEMPDKFVHIANFGDWFDKSLGDIVREHAPDFQTDYDRGTLRTWVEKVKKTPLEKVSVAGDNHSEDRH